MGDVSNDKLTHKSVYHKVLITDYSQITILGLETVVRVTVIGNFL